MLTEIQSPPSVQIAELLPYEPEMKIRTKFAYVGAWHFPAQEAHGMSLNTETHHHPTPSRQRAT